MNTATRVPFLLQQFFTQRLVNQKQVSSHTIASYRDTFQLRSGSCSNNGAGNLLN